MASYDVIFLGGGPAGYVGAIRCGQLGLSTAVIERERPEIALVDVGLPCIDGYEVARRARAGSHGRDVRLIALSGYGGADFEKRAQAAGFDLHVTKPIELERLRELLDGPAAPP